MSQIAAILDQVVLPQVVPVRQSFDTVHLADPPAYLSGLLQQASLPIKPGQRIAVTCGSRGIDCYAPLLRVIVDHIKNCGATPWLIPAMGSHGGATAQGQTELLASLGISQDSMGAAVVSSMEVGRIGCTAQGLPVYIDQNALKADGIILFNRVKPHTSFRGKYESGLLKMLAIGLAKQKGADMTHCLRYNNMAQNIQNMGLLALSKLPVLCGIATVENAYNQVAQIHLLTKKQIAKEEPAILQKARSLMPRICLDQIDALIVGRAGKDISGTGMDTNITGRYHSQAASGGPATTMLGVLELTEASHGNANGVGIADFACRRIYDKIDFNATYINVLTSTEPSSAKLPVLLDTDKQVFQACVKLCGRPDSKQVKLAVIRDTKSLDSIYLSAAAIADLAVGSQWQVGQRPIPLPFDAAGNLLLF